jgi:hypothetical protein
MGFNNLFFSATFSIKALFSEEKAPSFCGGPREIPRPCHCGHSVAGLGRLRFCSKGNPRLSQSSMRTSGSHYARDKIECHHCHLNVTVETISPLDDFNRSHGPRQGNIKRAFHRWNSTSASRGRSRAQYAAPNVGATTTTRLPTSRRRSYNLHASECHPNDGET